MEKSVVQKKVSDLGISAYLVMHGHKVLGKQQRVILFETKTNNEYEFNQLMMDYLSSEFHHFDSCLMSLKKMGECIVSPDVHTKPMNDLGAAAYMLMHGLKLAGRTGNTILFEVDPKDGAEFEQMQLDYLASDFHRFDSCLMSLKKINDSSTI